MSKIVHDGCMWTVSGILFNLIDPDPDQINIEDIAHGLAHNCRWNGHTKRYYSVADHSLRCYWHYVDQQKMKNKKVWPKVALAILLHDAEESYWSDVIRPIKNLFPEIEAKMTELREMIYYKYDVPVDEELKKYIKEIDNGMLVWEYANVVKFNVARGMRPLEAKKEFLNAFNTLYL